VNGTERDPVRRREGGLLIRVHPCILSQVDSG
jgi:hypothetical protein